MLPRVTGFVAFFSGLLSLTGCSDTGADDPSPAPVSGGSGGAGSGGTSASGTGGGGAGTSSDGAGAGGAGSGAGGSSEAGNGGSSGASGGGSGANGGSGGSSADTWIFDSTSSVAGRTPAVLGAPTVSETEQGTSVCFDGAADALVFAENPLQGLSAFTVQVLFRPDADGPAEQRFIHAQEDAKLPAVMRVSIRARFSPLAACRRPLL